jgi:hypothetical protein
MIETQYFLQLEKVYPAFLSGIIRGDGFAPVTLRGGKNKPTTPAELHNAIAAFLRHEKKADQSGWEISWERWQSKTLGLQEWPSSVVVGSEADFVYLLKKEKEVALFRAVVKELLCWNPAIRTWLAERPQRVQALKDEWKGICTVVDYLLQHDVTGYYIRSLPVPVHTKFIQQNKAVIFSLLQHLDGERFPVGESSLEKALGLQEKPVLYSLRWLDPSLAERYSSGMPVIGVTPTALQAVNWPVGEVWLVENETNLYLLPERQNAMALCSKGYALRLLKEIPFFGSARLLYWGDLDEDGYLMLDQVRGYYPHVQSVLMDEATVAFHQGEMQEVPFRGMRMDLRLKAGEAAGYALLMERGGRIEQEQLQQAFVQGRLGRWGEGR